MLPKNRPPTHPGEMLLKEFLEPMGVSRSKLAQHIGWSYAKVKEIIKGKRSISAEDALAIGEALGTDPIFWLNLQRDWDLWQSLQKYHHVSPLYPLSSSLPSTIALEVS